MAENSEPWVPSSKDDWSDVFADGFRKVLSERDEAESKKAAEEAANNKGGEGGDSDGNGNGFSWAKRLLG